MSDTNQRTDCPLCGGERLEFAFAYGPSDPDPFGYTGLELFLCSKCGFGFRTPRPDRSALERHYRDALEHPTASDPDREQAIERLAMSCAAEGRLLDVGCGPGDLLAALQLPDWRVVGIEPSSEAADVARARGIEVHSSLLETNEFPPEVFDVVTCVNALDLAYDAHEFLAHLERLLRPGGGLYLELGDPLRALTVHDFFAPERLSVFTPATLVQALAEFGLDAHTVESEAGAVLRVVARKVGIDKTNVDEPEDHPDLDELRAVLARFASGRAA